MTTIQSASMLFFPEPVTLLLICRSMYSYNFVEYRLVFRAIAADYRCLHGKDWLLTLLQYAMNCFRRLLHVWYVYGLEDMFCWKL